jgi:hypothetical protein
LNRDRSVYNDEIESVSAILSRRYDLREVSVLGSGYLKATKRDSAISVDEARRTSRVDDTGYRHLAGTLKPEAARGLSGTHAAPLVGIGVTLRNRALYLSESLDSLLAQTHARFQLVLVDDGSTDGTEAIARAYAERDSRVRYVRFPERRGMVAAWRAAFEEATAGGSSYFAWASDHDRWHPHPRVHHPEQQRPAGEASPGQGVADGDPHEHRGECRQAGDEEGSADDAVELGVPAEEQSQCLTHVRTTLPGHQAIGNTLPIGGRLSGRHGYPWP